jgi:hypothetical protein
MGADRFQLDPSRHLAIPSHNGFACLARRAGLIVEQHEFDGTALTFEMIESYPRDISFTSVPGIEAHVAASSFRGLAR